MIANCNNCIWHKDGVCELIDIEMEIDEEEVCGAWLFNGAVIYDRDKEEGKQ